MKIGGSDLVTYRLDRGEKLLLESSGDVEEVSSYLAELNPLKLFKFGATFYLGRLFLTTYNLILLPYSATVVESAKFWQKLTHSILDQVDLGIPQAEIDFSLDPLAIPLDEIGVVNPFHPHIIHPCLRVFTEWAGYQFKFVDPDEPDWFAEEIASVSAADVLDLNLAECERCGRIAVNNGKCAVCGRGRGPTASEIMSGEYGIEYLKDVFGAKGVRGKVAALVGSKGHNKVCEACGYCNHKAAPFCKYCRHHLG